MIIRGDSGGGLPLRAGSVQCVVTSPPYWGLRDYGVSGQIGLEDTPEEYVERLVGVFREVWRVLRDDGTVWLNMGDAYAGGGRGGNPTEASSTLEGGKRNQEASIIKRQMTGSRRRDRADVPRSDVRIEGLKAKDLIGIPWRVAFALQASGWRLRSDIIWHKRNPMPESVRDRPTRSHEYVFLLTKKARYYYDADAIREDASPNTHARLSQKTLHEQQGGFKQDLYEQGFPGKKNRDRRPADILKAMATKHGVGPKASRNEPGPKQNGGFAAATAGPTISRNKRDVWTIPTAPCPEAHFATFPPKLVEPCVLAGSRPGDVVLDPFAGTGTAVAVAYGLGRKGVGIELSGEYVEIAKRRTSVQLGFV